MKKTILIILPALIALAGCTRCSTKPVDDPAQGLVTVQYTSDDAKFPNPERGFYRYSDSNGSQKNLSASWIRGQRNNYNITLIFRYFYLGNHRGEETLDAQILADFENDMNTIREGGAKCVLRFVYSGHHNMETGVTEPDAPLNIIQGHLDQLKPYLEKHQDVIYLLQAGLIGAWGEWYYSTNFGTPPSTGVCDQVLTKILETLPTNRTVQVRYQGHKKRYVQRTTPLTAEEAFSGTAIARIGHHNDCFLASLTDHGTYDNDVEASKDYLNRDCLFVPNGGETCPPSGVDPADGLKAYNEMRRLRFSYLNDDYYNGVNNLWIATGHKDKIIKELGYRFELISGSYTGKTAPGNQFTARISLKNVGFAPLYNERKVELILKNMETGGIYCAVLNEVEPRSWRPTNMTGEIDVQVGIPNDMPLGQYKLYLNLPDIAETLHGNPDYSIRLANTGVWEAATGYNDLNMTVSIEAGAGKAYAGSNYFK